MLLVQFMQHLVPIDPLKLRSPGGWRRPEEAFDQDSPSRRLPDRRAHWQQPRDSRHRSRPETPPPTLEPEGADQC
jgi:hypothetical protein